MQNITHIISNAFTGKELQPYINRINEHYNNYVAHSPDMWESWEARTMTIPDDCIVQAAAKLLESSLGIELKCHDAQIQIWPEDCSLRFHRHGGSPRGQHGIYNSMLYLNDDFHGGEFITETGVQIKPRVGTLSFFNGNDYRHGIAPFYGNHRYTIIFWWSYQSSWI